MDRYSFSGKGEVLLKAGVAGTYGGKIYAANEPIAYFKDVLVSINFSNIEKVARRGTSNYLANSESEASFLNLRNIKSTESLQSLLYRKRSNKTDNRTLVKNLESIDGILYLPIQSTETLTDYIFVFDAASNKVTTYTFDKTQGTVAGLSNGFYTIFYQVDTNSTATFELMAPTMANMKAEITVEGNLNGTSGLVVIHLNKINLLTRPELDFTSKEPFVDTLDFSILSEDNSTEVNYYG